MLDFRPNDQRLNFQNGVRARSRPLPRTFKLLLHLTRARKILVFERCNLPRSISIASAHSLSLPLLHPPPTPFRGTVKPEIDERRVVYRSLESNAVREHGGEGSVEEEERDWSKLPTRRL